MWLRVLHEIFNFAVKFRLKYQFPDEPAQLNIFSCLIKFLTRLIGWQCIFVHFLNHSVHLFMEQSDIFRLIDMHFSVSYSSDFFWFAVHYQFIFYTSPWIRLTERIWISWRLKTILYLTIGLHHQRATMHNKFSISIKAIYWHWLF